MWTYRNYTGIAQSFYQAGSVNDIADDSNSFAQTVFESSPLNRILKQGAPALHGNYGIFDIATKDGN